MPRVAVNGIEIEYEVLGAPDAAPLLLIMGLGAQLIHWDDEFCEGLAERGRRVIRFDNRDVGLSTQLDRLGVPDPGEAFARSLRGEPVEAPYLLDDMADDAAALLEALEIEAAHVVGASMGGMIAQVLALRHPGRVRTLTSIMSTTGQQDLPAPSPEAVAILMQPIPPGRDAYAERSVENARALHGSGFPFEEERMRQRAYRAFDRGTHPGGYARQLAAVMASPSREKALASLRTPTLVMHGDEDPLVPLAAGLATATAIPGAELEVLRGLGHDMPRPAWPPVIDRIARHTARRPTRESADAQRAAGERSAGPRRAS